MEKREPLCTVEYSRYENLNWYSNYRKQYVPKKLRLELSYDTSIPFWLCIQKKYKESLEEISACPFSL